MPTHSIRPIFTFETIHNGVTRQRHIELNKYTNPPIRSFNALGSRVHQQFGATNNVHCTSISNFAYARRHGKRMIVNILQRARTPANHRRSGAQSDVWQRPNNFKRSIFIQNIALQRITRVVFEVGLCNQRVGPLWANTLWRVNSTLTLLNWSAQYNKFRIKHPNSEGSCTAKPNLLL